MEERDPAPLLLARLQTYGSELWHISYGILGFRPTDGRQHERCLVQFCADVDELEHGRVPGTIAGTVQYAAQRAGLSTLRPGIALFYRWKHGEM